MSKTSVKSELMDQLNGSEKKRIHIIIYAFDGSFKCHDMTSKKRHSIDVITENKAKKLVKDPEYIIMFFQPSAISRLSLELDKNVPAWIDKVRSCVIPVDQFQEDLLKRFFDYNFPSIEFASDREYYARHPRPKNEVELYRGVDDIWGNYINDLATARGLHK